MSEEKKKVCGVCGRLFDGYSGFTSKQHIHPKDIDCSEAELERIRKSAELWGAQII